MYMEKLDHYFPEPAIRKLDRCHYKVPDKDEHRTELMALKEKIMYVYFNFISTFVTIKETQFNNERIYIRHLSIVHMKNLRRPHA